MKDARYWRIYYKVQELLASECIDRYIKNSDGGIRQESTLSPRLNREAELITKVIYYD